MICNICGSEDISLKLCKTGNYYKCNNCGATKGCVKDTTTPYGIFANVKMRQLRRDCHKLMDSFENGNPRWKTSRHRRSLYRRLANSMQLDEDCVHFGMLSELQLEQAKMIMEAWKN